LPFQFLDQIIVNIERGSHVGTVASYELMSTHHFQRHQQRLSRHLQKTAGYHRVGVNRFQVVVGQEFPIPMMFGMGVPAVGIRNIKTMAGNPAGVPALQMFWRLHPSKKSDTPPQGFW
jgi:hypothetical protein